MTSTNSNRSFTFRDIYFSIDLIWEVPLSILSFFFYRLNRLLISRLYRNFLARSSARSITWRLLDRSTLEMPISLPVLMTTGPRWNTHALIGTIGPLKISRNVSIRSSACIKSADSWTGVIYSFPDFSTISQFSSSNINSDDDWSSISLQPGLYILGLRYYGLSSSPRMPDVCLGDSEIIDGIDIPLDSNEVYNELESRSNFYYLFLHYYIYTLLRLRGLLPESFVRKEFLPVGDPDTVFRFGLLKASYSLHVETTACLLEGYRVFFTGYNRASMPFSSEEITATDWDLVPPKSDGFYLFRIRPRSSNLPEITHNDLRISLTRSL